MTDDTISRQAAIDAVRHSPIIEVQPAYMLIDKADVLKNIVMLPSAQRTGRWKVSDLPKGKMKYCSECGFGQYIADERQYRYCPNCGCAMEGEEE